MIADVRIQKETSTLKTKTGIAFLVALGLSGSAWAGQDNTNPAPQELRLELNLVDGSRIIGVECSIARSMGIPHSVDKTVSSPLEVGGTSVADYGFEGVIDELMIFDRALSDAEVKQLYDAQK